MSDEELRKERQRVKALLFPYRYSSLSREQLDQAEELEDRLDSITLELRKREGDCP